MIQAGPWRRAFAAVALLMAGSAALASPAALTDDDALAALQSAYARVVVPGESAQRYGALYEAVLQRVKRSHATEVDLPALAEVAIKVLEPLPPGTGEPAEVFKKSIQAALRTLDPYSRYIEPAVSGTERGDSSSSFSGVGLEVQSSEGAVRVVAPVPGGPAARAGLQAGDLIVRVDDQPLAGLPLADAIARLRGQAGTPVAITYQRAGLPMTVTVSVTRDTIRRQLLTWSTRDEVLVLKLSSFSGPVAELLTRAITESTATTQPRAMVLDLRGNPGGLLREAVKIADTFLTQGDIVSLRANSPGWRRTWRADEKELLGGVPMVVLIDGRSASASELVADALQYNGRATVMGQQSFGKGSVQTTYPLGDDRGALKLTTAIYHGPSGKTLHHVGVGPDVELIAPASGDAERGVPDHAPQARLEPARCAAAQERDPALACAIRFLRAGTMDAFVAGVQP